MTRLPVLPVSPFLSMMAVLMLTAVGVPGAWGQVEGTAEPVGRASRSVQIVPDGLGSPSYENDADGPGSPSYEGELAPPIFPEALHVPDGSVLPADCVPCDNDFWIVSTWDCPQKGKHAGCVGCPFGYYRCGGCDQLCRFDCQAFLNWLKPGVPLCVVIHGSYTNRENICSEAVEQYRWLRAAAGPLTVQFVFFSWPGGSLTPIPNPDMITLGCRSSFNGIYLAQWITLLPPETPISLLGFSLGSRMIATGLHLLGGGEVKGTCGLHAGGRRIRATMITAAIDHYWLNPGERYGQALCAAESIVYLRNGEDSVLAWYPLRRPFSHRALGRIGLKPDDRAALGPFNARLIEWDVTGRIGRGHMWPNYVRRPEIASMLAPRLAWADAVILPEMDLVPLSE